MAEMKFDTDVDVNEVVKKYREAVERQNGSINRVVKQTAAGKTKDIPTEMLEMLQADINMMAKELYKLAGSLQDSIAVLTSLDAVRSDEYRGAVQTSWRILNGLSNLIHIMPELWAEVTAPMEPGTEAYTREWYSQMWLPKVNGIGAGGLVGFTWEDIVMFLIGY